jgi:hypothetical protein
LFEQLESYPWATDEEFQSGLRAILGPSPNTGQAEHLTLRARCFYYSRQDEHPAALHTSGSWLSRKHNISIDFPAYQTWHARHNARDRIVDNSSPRASLAEPTSSNAIAAQVPEAPSDPPAYPTSFGHIVELITTGQPIPGIKEIPSTILEGQASNSTSAKRKKPWEKDCAEATSA